VLKKRTILAVFLVLLVLTALPLSATTPLKNFLYAFVRGPVAVSRAAAGWTLDLWYFRRNAKENRLLRHALGESREVRFQTREALSENRRLTKLLDIKQSIPPPLKKAVVCRVIGRSPSTWNRVFLIDKGSKDGIRPGMGVLAERALAGRVAESWPNVSLVLLVTDPNSRVGALVQRTRQPGILFGTLSGGCRIKYLSVDHEVKKGDLVETGGVGASAAKGLLVGTIQRVWKEPGQIYQVADVKPFADLNRLEEVLVVE